MTHQPPRSSSSVHCRQSGVFILQSAGLCVCVCASYTGFVLMAAQLSEDVLAVGGAYGDLRETRQALRRHIELGAHLRHTCIADVTELSCGCR